MTCGNVFLEAHFDWKRLDLVEERENGVEQTVMILKWVALLNDGCIVQVGV